MFLYTTFQEDEEGDETTTLVVYDRLEDFHRRKKRCSPDGFEMASVNANPEDVIANADIDGPSESDFSNYPGSINRSYDEGDENEDLLEEGDNDKDDHTLVACLAPKDRYVFTIQAKKKIP